MRLLALAGHFRVTCQNVFENCGESRKKPLILRFEARPNSSDAGTGGFEGGPQYLADQLTLFCPPFTAGTSNFFHLPASLNPKPLLARAVNCEYTDSVTQSAWKGINIIQ